MVIVKPCVLWTGAITRGYGHTTVRVGRKQINVRVHRLVCEFFHGPPPPGKPEVCHSCDVKNCYEPSHLRWGSRADNVRDAMDRGRLATGARSGSSLHPETKPRGEAHWKAKLTARQVATIRRRAADGEVKARLAREYGIGKSHVTRLCLGQSWRHV